MSSQLRRAALAVSVAAMLALAPAALGSGGANPGGVNSGGGGGGGGATTTAPSPPSSSCARIASFGNSTGYYAVWAAIWTPFSISSSCPTAVSWQMTYTNGNTGLVDFVRGSSTAYMSSGT